MDDSFDRRESAKKVVADEVTTFGGDTDAGCRSCTCNCTGREGCRSESVPIGFIDLHLECGTSVPHIEAYRVKTLAAQLMHEPWRHGASLDADA